MPGVSYEFMRCSKDTISRHTPSTVICKTLREERGGPMKWIIGYEVSSLADFGDCGRNFELSMCGGIFDIAEFASGGINFRPVY